MGIPASNPEGNQTPSAHKGQDESFHQVEAASLNDFISSTQELLSQTGALIDDLNSQNVMYTGSLNELNETINPYVPSYFNEDGSPEYLVEKPRLKRLYKIECDILNPRFKEQAGELSLSVQKNLRTKHLKTDAYAVLSVNNVPHLVAKIIDFLSFLPDLCPSVSKALGEARSSSYVSFIAFQAELIQFVSEVARVYQKSFSASVFSKKRFLREITQKSTPEAICRIFEGLFQISFDEKSKTQIKGLVMDLTSHESYSDIESSHRVDGGLLLVAISLDPVLTALHGIDPVAYDIQKNLIHDPIDGMPGTEETYIQQKVAEYRLKNSRFFQRREEGDLEQYRIQCAQGVSERPSASLDLPLSTAVSISEKVRSSEEDMKARVLELGKEFNGMMETFLTEDITFFNNVWKPICKADFSKMILSNADVNTVTSMTKVFEKIVDGLPLIKSSEDVFNVFTLLNESLEKMGSPILQLHEKTFANILHSAIELLKDIHLKRNFLRSLQSIVTTGENKRKEPISEKQQQYARVARRTFLEVWGLSTAASINRLTYPESTWTLFEQQQGTIHAAFQAALNARPLTNENEARAFCEIMFASFEHIFPEGKKLAINGIISTIDQRVSQDVPEKNVLSPEGTSNEHTPEESDTIRDRAPAPLSTVDRQNAESVSVPRKNLRDMSLDEMKGDFNKRLGCLNQEQITLLNQIWRPVLIDYIPNTLLRTDLNRKGRNLLKRVINDYIVLSPFTSAEQIIAFCKDLYKKVLSSDLSKSKLSLRVDEFHEKILQHVFLFLEFIEVYKRSSDSLSLYVLANADSESTEMNDEQSEYNLIARRVLLKSSICVIDESNLPPPVVETLNRKIAEVSSQAIEVLFFRDDAEVQKHGEMIFSRYEGVTKVNYEERIQGILATIHDQLKKAKRQSKDLNPAQDVQPGVNAAPTNAPLEDLRVAIYKEANLNPKIVFIPSNRNLLLAQAKKLNDSLQRLEEIFPDRASLIEAERVIMSGMSVLYTELYAIMEVRGNVGLEPVRSGHSAVDLNFFDETWVDAACISIDILDGLVKDGEFSRDDFHFFWRDQVFIPSLAKFITHLFTPSNQSIVDLFMTDYKKLDSRSILERLYLNRTKGYERKHAISMIGISVDVLLLIRKLGGMKESVNSIKNMGSYRTHFALPIQSEQAREDLLALFANDQEVMKRSLVKNALPNEKNEVSETLPLSDTEQVSNKQTDISPISSLIDERLHEKCDELLKTELPEHAHPMAQRMLDFTVETIGKTLKQAGVNTVTNQVLMNTAEIVLMVSAAIGEIYKKANADEPPLTEAFALQRFFSHFSTTIHPQIRDRISRISNSNQ